MRVPSCSFAVVQAAFSSLVMLLLFVTSAPLRAAEETPLTPLEVADRLYAEAARQHAVDRRMETVTGRFQEIILDLISNELLDQAKGQELRQAVQVLQLLGHQHVPNAARHLEEARRQIAVLAPNLKAAEGEINIILRELDRLLKKIGPQHTMDSLLIELRSIIREEKAVHESTKRWGAQLYQSPSAAEKERRPLAENQSQIADRVRRFQEGLRESQSGETDPARQALIEKANQLLQQKPITPLLTGASTDITQRRPVPAVSKQAGAIQALEALEKLLQPDHYLAELDAMREMRQQLEDLLKDQQELRERTSEVAAAEFDASKNPLQADQRELQNRLDSIQAGAPAPVTDNVRAPLNSARQEMREAETQIAQTEQQPAVQSQQRAEENLQQAIAALDEDIAAYDQLMQAEDWPNLADLAQQALDLAEEQRELREQTGEMPADDVPRQTPAQDRLRQQTHALNQQLPLPQFQAAMSRMQSASHQLQQSQQPEAMQHQAAAEQALRDAAEALNAAALAIDLAQQQADLMQQTAGMPGEGLPALSPPQSALGQQAAPFPPAAGFMQQAGQSLEESEGQQAMGEQMSAIQSLVGEAAGALGMTPGMMAGLMPGLMPGMMPGMIPMPGPAFRPMEFGSRSYGRQRSAGPDVSKGDAHWGTAAPRDREMLFQKYARELPLEYRQVIQDYYEALSK